MHATAEKQLLTVKEWLLDSRHGVLVELMDGRHLMIDKLGHSTHEVVIMPQPCTHCCARS